MSYLAGQAEVRQQSGVAVAGELLEAWLIGDGLDELADPGAEYRRVTVPEVQKVAARYLVAGERAEGVVRGAGGGRARAVGGRVAGGPYRRGGVPDAGGQPPGDHVDTMRGACGRARHDVHQAEPFVRRGVQDDVPLPAEQPDRECPVAGCSVERVTSSCTRRRRRGSAWWTSWRARRRAFPMAST